MQCSLPSLRVESSSYSVELAFGCVIWVHEGLARSPEELVPATVIGATGHTAGQAVALIREKVPDVVSWADEGWLLFPLV
eukprot:5979918-Amphidinium_carterae.1